MVGGAWRDVSGDEVNVLGCFGDIWRDVIRLKFDRHSDVRCCGLRHEVKVLARSGSGLHALGLVAPSNTLLRATIASIRRLLWSKSTILHLDIQRYCIASACAILPDARL